MKRTLHERQMTEAFWQSFGQGSLILDYPLVTREKGSQRRVANGLILVNGEFLQRTPASIRDLTGQEVMVLQTKAFRTDPALVGQALLSPLILRRSHPELGFIKSTLISASPEPFLSTFVRRYKVQEVTPGTSAGIRQMYLPRVPSSDLDRLHAHLGGAMLLNVPLAAPPEERPLLIVDAVILADRPWNRNALSRSQTAQQLVQGARATAIVSTRGPLGMYVAGLALVARELLLAAGAVEASAIALVGLEDRAVGAALSHFPGVSVRAVSS